MPDLVDRIQAEIRERLDVSRAAVQEYERLEAALAALDASPRKRGISAPQTRTTDRGGQPGTRRRRPRPRGRAKRGANREAVLRIVGERPGITTSELATASRVEKRTLYTLLSKMTKQELLERQQLPGGQTGYRLREAAAAAPSAAAQTANSAE